MQNTRFTKSLATPRIAYIVSAFPVLTETFILYDIIAMEMLGVAVELYPLRWGRAPVTHEEAERWIRRAHYHPFFSLSVLRAQWHFIRRDPAGYFQVWAEVLRGTWGSANFFLGAIALFPKAVLFAYEMVSLGITHVHAHFANHPAVAALIIHRLTGIPFSFTARGTDIQVDQHMLRDKVDAAECAIAVSSYNKKIIVDECGPGVREKVHVIYGGVDVDLLSPDRSRSDGPFQILCVARFEEVKGHAYLVEACRLLRERGVVFECRLLGNGPLLPVVEKQVANAGLLKEVRLLGPRTYHEVVCELQQADTVVLPTAPTASGKCEGIPNVLKEAMACGLPVIASAVGGIPELVDDGRTGFLVPPKNAAALADALQRLSEDEALRCQFGRAGRAKVVRDFNLRISTERRASLFLRDTRRGSAGRDSFNNPESQVTVQHSL